MRSLRLSFKAALVPVLFTTSVFASAANASLSIDAQVRLLAGYQPQGAEAASPEVQQITSSADWRSAAAGHSMAHVMKSSPGYFSQSSMAKIGGWFQQNTPEAYNGSRNVLYLFGGADVLYPSVLFPNQQRLLIVGLEGAGTIYNPQQLAAQGQLGSQMGSIALAWNDLVNFSFFLTKHMKTDLAQFGTSTMIAVGLVARGNTITSFEQVSLDRSGVLQQGAGGRVNGIRIAYVKPNGQQADVLYFSMDLSDGNLKSKPEFQKFIAQGSFETAYYKAASYVSHNQGFQGLNRFVLSTVSHVIENDDGIPFSAIAQQSSQWNMKLYGIYSTPAALFGSHTDFALKAAYDETICASSDAENLAVWHKQWSDACKAPAVNYGFVSLSYGGTLPFRYGYTWQTGASAVKSKFSNLIVIDKR